MKLDPNAYRRTLDALRPQIILFGSDPRKLTELAVASHVPLLAVVLYAYRVLGPNPIMFDRAYQLMEFYQYKEVTPWKDPIECLLPSSLP